MEGADRSVGGWILQKREELEVRGYEGTKKQKKGWSSI